MRRPEELGDPNGQLSAANRVVADGRVFRDTEMGVIVFVKGNRAVATNVKGKQLSGFKLTRSTLRKRIKNGRFIPIKESD